MSSSFSARSILYSLSSVWSCYVYIYCIKRAGSIFTGGSKLVSATECIYSTCCTGSDHVTLRVQNPELRGWKFEILRSIKSDLRTLTFRNLVGISKKGEKEWIKRKIKSVHIGYSDQAIRIRGVSHSVQVPALVSWVVGKRLIRLHYLS